MEEKKFINPKYEVIVCPFCGESHRVLNLISALTNIDELWSDTRRIMPACPRIFPVHHCEKCGSYYFVRPEQYHYVDMDMAGEIRTLDYRQLKAARQFFEDYQLTEWQEEQLNVELFLSYNDEFNRREDSPIPSEEDKALFREVTDWIFRNSAFCKSSIILQAEVLRLRGEFQEAQTMLWDYPDEAADAWVAKAIFQHALAHDSKPFLLIKDQEHLFPNEGNE